MRSLCVRFATQVTELHAQLMHTEKLLAQQADTRGKADKARRAALGKVMADNMMVSHRVVLLGGRGRARLFDLDVTVPLHHKRSWTRPIQSGKVNAMGLNRSRGCAPLPSPLPALCPAPGAQQHVLHGPKRHRTLNPRHHLGPSF